jgi:hypothetical protein
MVQVIVPLAEVPLNPVALPHEVGEDSVVDVE